MREALKRRFPQLLKVYRGCRDGIEDRKRELLNKNTAFPCNRGDSFTREILDGCWSDYLNDRHPKDRRMRELCERIPSTGTENIRFLFNEIARRLGPGKTYLEVGVYRGASLLAAALHNPGLRCIGIDSFDPVFEADPQTSNARYLKLHRSMFGDPRNIEFYNADYRQAIKKLFASEPGLKVDFYYYDGDHTYENQLEGLRVMVPFMASRCLVAVDDINYPEAETATDKFLAENPDFRTLLKIKTSRLCRRGWWNGVQLLGRGY